MSPICIKCRRSTRQGADFWRNRSKPNGYQVECVDCCMGRRRDTREERSAYDENAEGMSFKAIALELGLTAERVRQIEASALRKLRNSARVMMAVRKILEGR